jgi:RHS repeat-associated protein
VRWLGWSTTAWHEDAGQHPVAGYEHYWYGGLLDGMRDASGQMYMRNRYYDPATGQFTQTDPIGLAGGFNAHRFANGDPVSYSDPYGLAPDTIVPVGDEARSALVGLYLLAQFASESDDPKVAAAGSALLGGLTELHAHPK